MPFYISYLIKLSISLTIVWLFYRLLLQRLTFYTWNRWYLLVYSLLSFVIPLININPWVEKQSFRDGTLINYIPVLPVAGEQESAIVGSVKPENAQLFISGWSFLLWTLLLGAGILLVRLCVRILSFQRIRRHARLMPAAEEELNAGIRLYHVDENIIPFSFGKSIYINQHLHTEKEWQEIIVHEYVHVRQRHTIDILVGEALYVLNWYNPFAWLLRFSIRQNLEFIADNKVLENGSDRKAYQYHLLKVVGGQPYRIANSFNFSSLKKRIIMMNRIKSARIQLVKFLFLLPLMAVLLLAFRDRYEDISNKLEKTFHSFPSDAGKTPGPVDIGIPPTRKSDSGLSPDSKNTDAQKRDTTSPDNSDAASVKSLLKNLIVASPASKQMDTLSPAARSSSGDTLALPQNLLYVLDGKQMPPDWSPRSVPTSTIVSMDVLKGKTATDLFGTRAANGAILITTTDSAAAGKPRIHITYGVEQPVNPEQDSVVLRSPGDKVVIGFPADSKVGGDARDLAPRTVIGSAGTGKEGVEHIVIGRPATEEQLRHRPVIYVDGVEVDSAQFSKISPTQIQSIIVYKGETATKKYGEKAKNGVISVTLKKPTSALPARASAVAIDLKTYGGYSLILSVGSPVSNYPVAIQWCCS